MDWIIETVYSNTLWLYKVIYSNKLFFIDFWTFNHIWSGAFVFIILSALKAKKKWIILIIVLFTYEIIEISFRIFALNLFKPEIIKDQINDIIFGIFGAILCYFIIKFRKGKSYDKFHLRYPLTSFLTAGTFSYLYVGFSSGTDSILNPLYFKIILLVLFWIIFYYLLQAYEALKQRKSKEYKIFILLTVIFSPAIIIVHFLAEHFLSFYYNNKLITISGLIFSLGIPALVIAIFRFFKKLINKAMMNISFTQLN